MNVIVGLDVGTKTITGAVLGRSGKHLRLIDFFVENVPEMVAPKPGPPTPETVDLETDVPMSLNAVIKQLLADHNLQGADVVASIDAKDCIIREIVMDFTKDSDIQRTIKFEAENYLVTMDVDDMVLEYLKVGEQNGKSQLILVAVRNRVISDRLQFFKEAGVDPISIDLDAMALYNAFTLTPAHKSDPENNCLLIDMGKTTTKVLLIEKGKLRKIRSLRMGAYQGAHAHRRIAEPVGAGAKALPGASPFQLLDASSIEARFEEIENALRRLDPLAGDPAASHALQGEDEPIAILTDEEYDRITELQRSQAFDEPPGGNGQDGPGLQAAAAPAGLEGRSPFGAPGGSEEGFSPLSRSSSPEEGRASFDPSGGTAAAAAAEPGNDGEFYRLYLDRLGQEIQRTFTTSLLAAPIDLICLTGGMSAREEARQFFQENFDVETIQLDFGGSGDSFEMNEAEFTGEKLAELNRVGALAVGLAVKELGHDQIGFDFRQNQFRYERRFEKLKYPLLLTAMLLCTCFLQTAVDLFREYQSLDNKIQVLHGREGEIFKTFFGESNESNLLAPQARNKKTQWDQLLGVGGGDIPNFIDEIETIKDVSEVFKEARSSGIDFEVDMIDLKFRTRQRTGVGTTESGSPALQAESESQIILVVGEGRLIGSELVNLFKTRSKIWEVSPSETTLPDGKIKVILKLIPKESYLRSLRS